MLFGLFGKKKTKENALIIDVGSASVSVGLVQLSRSGAPILLLSHRTPIIMQGGRSGKKLADATIAALRVSALKVQKMAALYTEKDGRVAPQRVDSIAVSLASPWYHPKAKLLRLDRDTPFSLSRSLITKLLRDEAATTLNNTEFGASVGKGELELIERLILTVALNGYETKDIYASGIKRADLGLYMSFIPGDFGNRIRRELEKIFTERPLTFHSFPLMLFLALRIIAPDLSRALLIDVAGEITDVTLIEGGMIRGISSFPLGKQTLRSLIPVHSPEEGETVLRLHGKDASRMHVQKTDAVMGGLRAWSKSFGEAVGKLLDGATMPRFIYVMADEHVLPLYINAIESESFGTVFASGGRSVVGITPALLMERCRLGSLVTAPDAFLMVEGMVADTFFDRDETLNFLSTNVSLQE